MINATLRFLVSAVLIFAVSIPTTTFFLSMINEKSDVAVGIGFIGMLVLSVAIFKSVEYVTTQLLVAIHQRMDKPQTPTQE